MHLLLEGITAIGLQQIPEQLLSLRLGDGPRSLQSAEANGRPVGRRHVWLLGRVEERLAVLPTLLQLVLGFCVQVLLSILHSMQFPLLFACEGWGWRGSVSQEPPSAEHLLVAHCLEHAIEVFGRSPLDIPDFLLSLLNVGKDLFPEFLVHVLGDLLDLREDFQGLICFAEAFEGLRFSEQSLLVVCFQLQSGVCRSQRSLPTVHFQCRVGLVVETSSVHSLQLLVFL
mmetsp:Transcript_34554/g.55543  ORF Transcript_34554/g.55543 Transcript_34554/m.55543 type:complete len:228 (-) Transcript_34554:677-1360(-)